MSGNESLVYTPTAETPRTATVANPESVGDIATVGDASASVTTTASDKLRENTVFGEVPPPATEVTRGARAASLDMQHSTGVYTAQMVTFTMGDTTVSGAIANNKFVTTTGETYLFQPSATGQYQLEPVNRAGQTQGPAVEVTLAVTPNAFSPDTVVPPGTLTVQPTDETTAVIPVVQPTDGTTPVVPVVQPTDGTTPVIPVVQPTDGITPVIPVVQPTDGTTPVIPVVQPTDGTTPVIPVVPPTDGTTQVIPAVQPGDGTTPVIPVVQPTDGTTALTTNDGVAALAAALHPNDGTRVVVTAALHPNDGTTPIITAALHPNDGTTPSVTAALHPSDGTTPIVTAALHPNDGTPPVTIPAVQPTDGTTPVTIPAVQPTDVTRIISAALQPNDNPTRIISGVLQPSATTTSTPVTQHVGQEILGALPQGSASETLTRWLGTVQPAAGTTVDGRTPVAQIPEILSTVLHPTSSTGTGERTILTASITHYTNLVPNSGQGSNNLITNTNLPGSTVETIAAQVPNIPVVGNIVRQLTGTSEAPASQPPAVTRLVDALAPVAVSIAQSEVKDSSIPQLVTRLTGAASVIPTPSAQVIANEISNKIDTQVATTISQNVTGSIVPVQHTADIPSTLRIEPSRAGLEPPLSGVAEPVRVDPSLKATELSNSLAGNTAAKVEPSAVPAPVANTLSGEQQTSVPAKVDGTARLDAGNIDLKPQTAKFDPAGFIPPGTKPDAVATEPGIKMETVKAELSTAPSAVKTDSVKAESPVISTVKPESAKGEVSNVPAAKVEPVKADAPNVPISKAETSINESQKAPNVRPEPIQVDLQGVPATRTEAVRIDLQGVPVTRTETAAVDLQGIPATRPETVKVDLDGTLAARPDVIRSYIDPSATVKADGVRIDNFAPTSDRGMLNQQQNADAKQRLEEEEEKARKEKEEQRLLALEAKARQDAAFIAIVEQRRLNELKAKAMRDAEKVAETEKKKNDDNKRRRYIVCKGDTLQSIATSQLRDVNLTPLIHSINRLAIPCEVRDGETVYVIRVGQVIWLPSNNEIKQTLATIKRGERPEQARSGAQELEARFGANWGGDQTATPRNGVASKFNNADDKTIEQKRRNIESLLGNLSSASHNSERIQYRVRLGDTLRSIALNHPMLKDVSLWKLLAEVNGIPADVNDQGASTSKLLRGSILNMPTLAEIEGYGSMHSSKDVIPVGSNLAELVLLR